MSFDDDDDDDARALNREKRLRKNLERLGFADPRCLICGEDDPTLLHRDHLDGREFSDVIWILCANHHTKRTDFQKDHPPKHANPKAPLEVHGRFVEGFGGLS